MEKLQHRLLHGHQASRDSDFIAATTPTPSSLARYHSAASPEASAALLAVPKTQRMTFPKQAYRLFLRRRFRLLSRRFLFAAALASRNQTLTDSEPTLSASAPRAGSALSLMTPWHFVSAIWQKRLARMPIFDAQATLRVQPAAVRLAHARRRCTNVFEGVINLRVLHC